MLPSKRLLSWGAAGLIIPCAAVAQVNVLTYHNDNGRTGQNLNENILTPANVKQSTFGKIFTYNVDDYVYAQPLYVSGVNIPGQGIHNVVFVATENNSVYALDADSNTGANGGVLWQINFGPAAPTPTSNFPFTPIEPEVGITSTPVIDPSSGIMYVDAFTEAGGNFSHAIHALNITNGTETAFSPVTVTATFPGVGAGSSGGVQTFQPGQELQRSALTLANGILYVAYAGYTDMTTTDPFHGWVIGFNASNLQQLPAYVFNTTPNGTTAQFGSIAGEGGIWMGGDGLAVDANNSLYFASGDGNFNAFNGAGGTEYGDSFVKLSSSGGLSVADYFTPQNQAFYRTNDLDVGSGGVMLLPDQPGSIPHMMIGAGKPGTAYLINRDQMTAGNDHFDMSQDAVLASVQLAGGCYNTPAYFNGTIYYAAWEDHLVGYMVSNASIPQIPNQVGSRIMGYPGCTPAVSANGTSNGIVWGVQRGPATGSGPPVLWACNATNISTEIYNSTQAGARDQLTNGVKFIAPTIANGKVYVGGQSNLTVFGLLAGALQFSSPTYTVQENAGTATITVNRLGGSLGAVQVNYATTAGGTAVQGQEYLSTSGALSWASGDSSSKTFNVTILDNDQAESNHTIFLVLSNATGGAALGASANAVLTILEDPYDLWKFTHFGANANNPAIAGNTADPTGDGIPNILKYAFALDPNLADTNRPVAGSIISNHFQLQFNRNTFATDLSYTVEASGSLTDSWSDLLTYSWPAGWVPNLPGSTVIESAPTGSPPDQPANVTITDPVNTSGPAATNRFFRLEIQQ
jgi:Calx-beta domain